MLYGEIFVTYRANNILAKYNWWFPQVQEWLLDNSDLPLPELTGDDTIYEYVVGQAGDWVHWMTRVRDTLAATILFVSWVIVTSFMPIDNDLFNLLLSVIQLL